MESKAANFLDLAHSPGITGVGRRSTCSMSHFTHLNLQKMSQKISFLLRFYRRQICRPNWGSLS
eukprot:6144669-Amphidinium_carterae.1